MEPSADHPILILGAGINGAAIARELAIGGLPVCVVDVNDLSYGATSRSSRLIHGGVRYLEYGEFSLVREALDERRRLLRLAPHLVRPLRLFIPVEKKWSGWWQAGWRFFGRPVRAEKRPRGLYLLRFGLWLYDWFGKDDFLPGATIHQNGDEQAPPVDRSCYPWLCGFDDAQISFPERLVVDMLVDAQLAAHANSTYFEVVTHCQATQSGGEVQLDGEQFDAVRRLQPSLIVNATGAWVDRTLQKLKTPAKRMIGGTKGSHLLTSHAGLREALSKGAVYAEAADGRPVFLIPMGELSMIGTTDLPFDEAPDKAVASPQEQQYLCDTANRVFPSLGLRVADIDWHYSGVRPLPFVGEGAPPAATTRRHFIELLPDSDPPMFSIVGGKITTCRSLAEEAAEEVCSALGRSVGSTSRERPLPGGSDYPMSPDALRNAHATIVEKTGLSLSLIEAVWSLFGTRTNEVLERTREMIDEPLEAMATEDFWAALARFAVRREWARGLSDIVERRLMLLYDPNLSLECLHRIADALVDEGVLTESEKEREIEACLKQLDVLYGKSF